MDALEAYLSTTLPELHLDAQVYSAYLLGLLDATNDVVEVEACVRDACNPNDLDSKALEAFLSRVMEMWKDKLDVELVQREKDQMERIRQTEAGFESLKLSSTFQHSSSAIPTASSLLSSSSSSLNNGPRLTAEEKQAILQATYAKQKQDESLALDESAQSAPNVGANANRLRVVEQRHEDLTFRSEQAKKQQAQSKKAEKAGKEMREEKKNQRKLKSGGKT